MVAATRALSADVAFSCFKKKYKYFYAASLQTEQPRSFFHEKASLNNEKVISIWLPICIFLFFQKSISQKNVFMKKIWEWAKKKSPAIEQDSIKICRKNLSVASGRKVSYQFTIVCPQIHTFQQGITIHNPWQSGNGRDFTIQHTGKGVQSKSWKFENIISVISNV